MLVRHKDMLDELAFGGPKLEKCYCQVNYLLFL